MNKFIIMLPLLFLLNTEVEAQQVQALTTVPYDSLEIIFGSAIKGCQVEHNRSDDYTQLKCDVYTACEIVDYSGIQLAWVTFNRARPVLPPHCNIPIIKALVGAKPREEPKHQKPKEKATIDIITSADLRYTTEKDSVTKVMVLCGTPAGNNLRQKIMEIPGVEFTQSESGCTMIYIAKDHQEQEKFHYSILPCLKRVIHGKECQ